LLVFQEHNHKQLTFINIVYIKHLFILFILTWVTRYWQRS